MKETESSRTMDGKQAGMAKTVAIIGAGASGLTAIKCCLDEGLQPTCFERSEDIGGLWRFQEYDIDGQASIYRSLTINTSKEMMSYSDFPIPADYPNYMHHSKVMEYFRMYAKHFHLLERIRFKACVCQIRKRPDFSVSGQWEVVTEMNGKRESAIFDAIMVCTGHHVYPYFPLESFPGVKKFKGKIMHSREYKHPEVFRDQKILVIGLGNSGADISVDLSHVAKQIFLSTRTGTWVVNRVSDDGYPLDVVHFTRFKTLLRQILPVALVNLWGEKKLNTRFNHENYGIKPQHRFLSRYPIAADDLPNAIISGRVLMKPNVNEFTEKGVIFEDGCREENIDVVIFATGYSFAFPFIDESVISVGNNQVPLYKFVFPPHLERSTLAIIGLLQPLGAIMPIAELQSRWATRVFKGLIKLPSADMMMDDVVKKTKKNEKWYAPSQHISLQVQYVDHMDELACLSGVKPKLLNLFLTDPKLALKVFFGPCSPVQFRLHGPGKWEGARDAILTQKERIVKATKTRAVQGCTGAHAMSVPCVLIKVLGCAAIFALLLAFL
ncbi:flavin-containing monooxygenase 5-like [Eublepharis macularius]|uniref:Flavin-containing monooxygenase n=1 Tax=Eublepharis macularius TaxID=481883 RepID=A0AA97L275_EUBMA|nr:flavin-containing monooxygenase 5-like [Eublepharis macularius]